MQLLHHVYYDQNDIHGARETYFTVKNVIRKPGLCEVHTDQGDRHSSAFLCLPKCSKSFREGTHIDSEDLATVFLFNM